MHVLERRILMSMDPSLRSTLWKQWQDDNNATAYHLSIVGRPPKSFMNRQRWGTKVRMSIAGWVSDFLRIEKEALIETMFLPLVHDVLIRKILSVIGGLTAVEFSTDMTLFRRWTNTSKKSFGAVHHSELDFVRVSTTL